MTDSKPSAQLADAITTAVLSTRGVAFLRPGLTDLLIASSGSGWGRPAGDTTRAGGGVRVVRQKDSEAWTVEVTIVLRRGHRALDVTRAVRAAVAETVRPARGPSVPVHVTVTVSGVV
ncbi:MULTISPECIES: Asp23/Gls24 family envelope stress response protein [Streptomyces]|uniref:Asp23/Gls24 family envelope stress response protein n=1 Tax=Streptomyces achmelvichensis TaxID=3134111 RepID=A0ACC6Q6Y4_9ACTN|nr:Asp23/Gls24 family envelope stress response protein [Streptomyces sp. NBC_01167]